MAGFGAQIARTLLARIISEWLGVQPPLYRGRALPQQQRDELTASLDRLDITALLADEFDPLSEREVLEIERCIEAALPADYRWFLRNYGASTTYGSWELVIAGGRYTVRWLYGRQTEIPSSDSWVPSLMSHLDIPVDFLEDAELPIATTWAGQLALNALTGDVSHISSDIDPPVRGLAGSFTELINALEPYDYDDEI